MAGTRKLVIEIVGNAKDATKAFGDVRSASDRTRERLSNFGTAALGIGTALAGGLAVAVGQFVEADTQSRKLDNSIANSTQTFTNNGEALRDLATQVQNLTGADGDALVGAEALAVQWGLSQDQITELLPLVNDLSMKMGVDVETAMRAVLKSTDGSAGALRKMGINIDQAKLAADPFGATIDALKGSVGGFGEEVGRTAAGKLNILKQQLGDLVEAIGGGALDVFGPLISGLSSLTGAAGDSAQSIGTFAGQFGVIAAASLLGIGGIVKIKGALDSAREALTDGTNKLNGFGKAAAGLSAVAAMVPVFDLLAGGINEAAGRAGQMTDAWNRLTIALGDGAAGASEVWSAFAEGVGAEQNTLRFQNLWQEFGAEVELVGTGVKADVEQVQRAFDDLGRTKGPEAQRAALDQLERATGKLDKSSRQYAVNTEFIERNRRSLQLKTDASKTDTSATDRNTDALKAQVDTLKAMTDPIFAVMNATDGEAKAQADAAAAQAEVTRLRQAGQTGTDAYRQAVEKANATALGSVRASVEAESAITSLAAGVRDGSVSTADFSNKLAEYVRTGRISQGTADILALKVGGVNNQLRNIPARVGSRVTVDTANASNDVSALQRRINNLRAALGSVGILTAAGRRQIEQQLAAAQFSPGNGMWGRAVGGPVVKDRPYLVGERGPEIVIPGSGYVIPNRELVSAPAAMTGGGGVTVNVTTGVGDAAAIGREVVRVLKAYERTSGTGWRQ